MSSKRRDKLEQAQTSHKIIEKRRRDRINNCLAELSQAVPSAFASKASGKLEKAEILEMTVHYLRALHAYGIRLDSPADQPVMMQGSTDTQYELLHQHYRNGYSDCMREIIQYVIEIEGICPQDQRCSQILNYLQTRMSKDLYQSSSYNEPCPTYHHGQSIANGHNGENASNSGCGNSTGNGVNQSVKDRRSKSSSPASHRLQLNGTKRPFEAISSTNQSTADLGSNAVSNRAIQMRQQQGGYTSMYQNHNSIHFGMPVPVSSTSSILTNSYCVSAPHQQEPVSKAVNDRSTSLSHGSM